MNSEVDSEILAVVKRQRVKNENESGEGILTVVKRQ